MSRSRWSNCPDTAVQGARRHPSATIEGTGGRTAPDPGWRRRLEAPVTAAQRLRLVLALGAINLVLASVAFAVGIVGVQSPPTTAGGPTPGIAFVSPAPTTAPEPTPASSPEPGTSTPGIPV